MDFGTECYGSQGRAIGHETKRLVSSQRDESKGDRVDDKSAVDQQSTVQDGDEKIRGDDVTVTEGCVIDAGDVISMDSSCIIPEAALQCGILPMDTADGPGDGLNPMSSAEASAAFSDPSTEKNHHHHHQQQQHKHQQHQQQQQQQSCCFGCKRPITDRYLFKVMDQFWHEDCLKCSCCDCRLGEVGSTLFTKANLLLCRRDYLRLFGATGCCSVCSKMIPAFEMVMKAKGNVYHLECFACQQCNHRFCIGDRFYLYDNKILCEFDYEERLVFARLSQGYNALSSIKRQTQSLNDLPATATCRASNLNGC